MVPSSIKSSQSSYPVPLGLPMGGQKAPKSNPLAKGKPISFQPAPKTVRPMSKYGANIVKGFVSLFSRDTFKKIGINGVKIGAGIAGGVAIAIFAGPQIHAAFIGLAASAVFPPVAIAIGATLGAAILAFGIYKLVQWGKAKLKAENEARAALAEQAQVQEPQVPPTYATSTQSSTSKQKTASVKSKAPSSVFAPSVAKSNAKNVPMTPVPEMDEEMKAWAAEGSTKN